MSDFLPFTSPSLDEETIAGVVEVLRSGWITSGPNVQKFEAQLSQLFGGRPVRAFNSGTATLEVALRLAGVGPGDEVITTPLSWVATSNVILTVGATPIFVDVDPTTRNLDLSLVEKSITSRTKAIIPVDLAGYPIDRDALYALANSHQLRVIEDAAQSIGSSWNGKLIGATGDLVSFSFHPNKNLTSIEGGCLVMNSHAEAKLAEQFRLQGVIRSGADAMDVEVLGGKFNLTDVAARVGIGQLARLSEFTEKRRQLARLYFEEFAKFDFSRWALQLPLADFNQANWHMFQVVPADSPEVPTRADILTHMRDSHQIGVGVHYPAIHLFSLYRKLGWNEGNFPRAEAISRRILTLPLFPSMKPTDVSRVVSALHATLTHLSQ